MIDLRRFDFPTSSQRLKEKSQNPDANKPVYLSLPALIDAGIS